MLGEALQPFLGTDEDTAHMLKIANSGEIRAKPCCISYGILVKHKESAIKWGEGRRRTQRSFILLFYCIPSPAPHITGK
jgi:hypothetical protein